MDQTAHFIAVTKENSPAPQAMCYTLYYPNLLLFLGLSIVVIVTRSRSLPRVSVSNGLFTVKFHKESVFYYLVTKNDNRFDMGLAVIYVMLNHIVPISYNFSVNIFLCDPRLPRERDIDFSFLSTVHPEVPVFVRNISHQGLNTLAGIEFPFDKPLMGRQIRWRNVAVVRTFIPLLFSADCFLYTDDDVIFRRHFFPEVMQYTRNQSKFFFAVRDHLWVISNSLRQRILSYDKTFTGPYFGNGFYLLKGNEIGRKEMRKAIEYFSQHMELLFIEQDAMNLAFNRARVELLPIRFCVILTEFRAAWNWAYGFHHTGFRNKPTAPLIRLAIQEYLSARDHWQSKHPPFPEVIQIEKGINCSKFLVI
jgi:hypothetical protein